jgi:hypothetical protein
MKKQLLFVIIIALSANYMTGAQILNGSFEADPNTPLFWGANGNAPEILTSFSTAPYYPDEIYRLVDIVPFEGQYFVMIQCGSRDSYCFSELTQRVTINAGQSITGAFFFATTDYLTWNDRATIKLKDPCSVLPEILLAYKDVNSIGDHNSMSGWETFSHDVNEAEAGCYVLTLRVENIGDCYLTSFLAVDALEIVPKQGCPYALEGDINSDCVVNFYDFTFLANQWLNDCTPTPCSADINPTPNGTVDFGDLAIMAGNWLIDCHAEPGNPACVPK